MKFKGIIFDMDGVIFDTEKIYLMNWQNIFKNYGYSLDKEIYIKCMGVGKLKVKEIFKIAFGDDLPIDIMYDEKDIYLEKYLKENEIELKIGVVEILDFLRKNNYKVALATSSRRNRVEFLLEKYNIKDKFDFIVCGEEVKRYKPNPDIFLTALNKLNLDKEEVLIVEDSKAGVLAGNNSCIKVIHIPDLIENDKEIEKLSFKVFSNLLELKNFLKN